MVEGAKIQTPTALNLFRDWLKALSHLLDRYIQDKGQLPLLQSSFKLEALRLTDFGYNRSRVQLSKPLHSHEIFPQKTKNQ